MINASGLWLVLIAAAGLHLPSLTLAGPSIPVPSVTHARANRSLAEDQSLGPVSGEGVTTVYTGAQLARSLADTRVTLILIGALNMNLVDEDWGGITTPVLVRRNVTFRGSPALGTWPFISLQAKRKVQLMSGVFLRASEVILGSVRAVESFWRAPGLDILVPTPDGTAASFTGVNMAVLVGACLPDVLMAQNMAAVKRPVGVPGVQRSTLGVPQPGCVNSSSAPRLQRCWPYINMIDDFVMAGADVDITSAPKPNNYEISMLNVSMMCNVMLTMDCIVRLGPIGCMIVTIALAADGPAGYAGAAVQPPPPEGGRPLSTPAAGGAIGGSSQQVPAGSGGGTATHDRSSIGAIAGSAVGGIAFLAFAAFIAFLAVRYRRRQRLMSMRNDFSQMSPKVAIRLDVEVASSSDATSGPLPGPMGQRSPLGNRGPATKTVMDDVITQRTPIRPDILTGEAAAAHGGGFPDDLRTNSTALADDSGQLSHAATTSIAGDVVVLLPVVLGKGAFGRVYEGMYRGRRVAVKQMLDPSEASSDMEGQHAAFAQELEVLGRCEHPNILRVLAACVTPPRPCLVMELMDTSLDKLLYGTEQLLPLPLVLHIASEIAQGLAYLHPTVLHRDLKPGNVLLNDPWGEHPAVKLADFGLSRLRNTILVTLNPEAGTPAYVAPECFTMESGAAETTYKADIYSFGVVLWEMLAGDRPWKGLGAVPIACQITLNGRRLPVPARNVPGGSPSRWPRRLCELLEECWDKDPDRRPAAAELAKRLVAIKQRMLAGALTEERLVVVNPLENTETA